MKTGIGKLTKRLRVFSLKKKTKLMPKRTSILLKNSLKLRKSLQEKREEPD